MNLTFDAAREGGFIFPGARGWINTRDTAHMQELAQDAALITTPKQPAAEARNATPGVGATPA